MTLRRCNSCGELMAMTWLGFTAHVRTGAQACHADDELEPIYAEYGQRAGVITARRRPSPPRSKLGLLAAESGIAYIVLYKRFRRGDRGEALTRPVRRYAA